MGLFKDGSWSMLWLKKAPIHVHQQVYSYGSRKIFREEIEVEFYLFIFPHSA